MHTTSSYHCSALCLLGISHLTPPPQSLPKAEPKYSFNDQQHVATGFAVRQNPKEIRT